MIGKKLLQFQEKLYLTDHGFREVDFVAEQGGGRFYVQVAYLLADDNTVEREFGALETIPDNFPKYVVTMDEINRSRNGIKHVNIRKFLLMESYE